MQLTRTQKSLDGCQQNTLIAHNQDILVTHIANGVKYTHLIVNLEQSQQTSTQWNRNIWLRFPVSHQTHLLSHCYGHPLIEGRPSARNK